MVDGTILPLRCFCPTVRRWRGTGCRERHAQRGRCAARIPSRETWSIGAALLPLRLAMEVTPDLPQRLHSTVRPNWRQDTRLPGSAPRIFERRQGRMPGGDTSTPALQDRIALVGFTPSGQ